MNKPDTNNENPLRYTEIQAGMKVIDDDGDIGTITECNDAHNILVEYDNGGQGLYCLSEGCDVGGQAFLYRY